MSNLLLHNKHNPRIRISYDEYWDFFLNQDFYKCSVYPNNSFTTECLTSYIDFSNELCIDGEWVYSLPTYNWESCVATDYILYNIGYTGVDNGLIRFRRDRISNEQFLKIYTESEHHIIGDDCRLKLHQVSGNTLQYDYPTSFENNAVKLNGGFYQGFFMTECDKYKVFPTDLNDGWCFEFVLNKTEFERENKKPLLNDKYPQNKGIFFYIGTRAENKWAYEYLKDDECEILSHDDYIEDAHIDKDKYIIGEFLEPNLEFDEFEPNIDNYTNFNYYDEDIYINHAINRDKIDSINDYVDDFSEPPLIDESLFKPIPFKCQSGCELFGDDYLFNDKTLDDGTDYIQGDLDISDFDYQTDMGASIKVGQQGRIKTDNKFLLFNRTRDGYTVDNWEEGTTLVYTYTKRNDKYNLFLYMNRTSTGYTVDNIHELYDKNIEEEGYPYNIYKDLYNNALAFQIRDDGSIGYKYIALNCDMENDIEVVSGFSKPNIIENDKWYTINVKIKSNLSKMKLYFYVNGKLKFISKELPLLKLRELHDLYEKQEGVPFNISLGGGSQGLIETILPNYMYNPYRVYPIEENFAGTFIGYIRHFRFYNCLLTFEDIKSNSKLIVR